MVLVGARVAVDLAVVRLDVGDPLFPWSSSESTTKLQAGAVVKAVGVAPHPETVLELVVL